MSFALTSTLRESYPKLPYKEIAEHVLGTSFDLSLVLCADGLATRMNATYRKKTYSPNVLSFPYEKSSGEIFLNVPKAAREARKLGISHKERLALLFVHGCHHLKGHQHGDTMERLEQNILRHFGLTE